MRKRAQVPRGCDVARKATWQSHADLCSAYVVRIIYFIYITYNIRGFRPPVYREGIRPLIPSGLINPTDRTNFFRVGLSPTHFLLTHPDALIAWSGDHRIIINSTCFNYGHYNGQISATWRHHARRSGGHAAHGSKIKHVPILKRYNGPDQISRETSGPSDQESRGVIGAFL